MDATKRVSPLSNNATNTVPTFFVVERSVTTCAPIDYFFGAGLLGMKRAGLPRAAALAASACGVMSLRAP